MWTMFEATFTTSWTQPARNVIEDVSAGFGIFWIIYIVVVNFAVMRVTAALFLKQTLAVAAADAEKMVMAKMKEREKYAEAIRAIFVEADTSGDGVISAE